MVFSVRIEQQVTFRKLFACNKIDCGKLAAGVEKNGFALLVADKNPFLKRYDNTVGVYGLSVFVNKIEFVVDRRFFPAERRNRENLLTGHVKIVLIVKNGIFIRVIGSCRSFALCGAFKICVILQRNFVSVNVADIPLELLVENVIGDIFADDFVGAYVIDVRCARANLI